MLEQAFEFSNFQSNQEFCSKSRWNSVFYNWISRNGLNLREYVRKRAKEAATCAVDITENKARGQSRYASWQMHSSSFMPFH